MISNHWLSIAHHSSQPLAQHYTPWSGCESWCVMLIKWLWIMVCNAEPVVVSHGVQCWANGCVSWCTMVSQCLLIMVCNSEPVVVNHGLLCCAKGCNLWDVMLCQWFWIVLCYTEPVVVNHGVLLTIVHNHWYSISHHDSQPLAQHNTT
jgi:hypothetical protein